MNKVLGICNLHDSPSLGQLTKNRPLGALSFLSRYALMDFTLSNFSNSEIDRVFILTESNISAVNSHVLQGNAWINNTRTGLFRVMLNEKMLDNPKFNTDIANIKNHLSVIEDVNPDYIVIAPAFFLMSIDFRDVLEEHEESGAEVTIVTLKTKKGKKEYLNCDSFTVENNGVISRVKSNVGDEDNQVISLEAFVFNRVFFEKMLTQSGKISALYGVRKTVNYLINHHRVIAHAYKYDGYVVPILSYNDFVNQSFDLLAYEKRQKIFLEDWPIYTTTHNTPPALYGDKAKVKNSFVGNGAIVRGEVENSIVSRDVIIEEGASVKNCILLAQTYVGKGAHLEYVLTDKGSKIVESKDLKGEKDQVLYIKPGETI